MYEFFKNVMVPPYHYGVLVGLCMFSGVYFLITVGDNGENITEQCILSLDVTEKTVVASCEEFGQFKMSDNTALTFLLSEDRSLVLCKKRVGGLLDGEVSCSWIEGDEQ